MESFFSYEFHKVFGTTIDECTQRVHDFFASDIFRNNIEPLDGAVEALKNLSRRFEIHCVTARQLQYEDLTKMWLNKHFGDDVISQVHFGNHY